MIPHRKSAIIALFLSDLSKSKYGTNQMTEAFTKPIVLTKENVKMIKKALSSDNRKKIEHFEKNIRPKFHSQAERKNKLSIKEIMKVYK